MSSIQYRLPKQITIEEIPFLEDALALKTYSFEVERQTLTNIVTSREKMQQHEKSLNERTEKYQAEKLQQQKAEARKIAPGFLDTETRILHPQPYYSNKTFHDENDTNSNSNSSTTYQQHTYSETVNNNNNNSNGYQYDQLHYPQQQQVAENHHHQHVVNTTSSPVASPPHRFRSSSIPAEANSTNHANQQDKRASSQSHFDYHRFEQGLAPPDPWDTPENDLVALRSILGNQDNKGEQENQNNQYTPMSMPSHTPQYSSPYQRPNTANVYSSDAGPWIRPPPPPHPHYQQQPLHNNNNNSNNNNNHKMAPALPPKVYNDTKSSSQPSTPPPPPPPPLSSTSSSLIQQQHQQQHGYPPMDTSISKPPLLPPLPPMNNNNNGSNEMLIQELANMGFSRSQAIDALQKNDNDLVRATNFLLDNT
ncbi:hypothetical protein BJ944DRAFT_241069 [Cunninghamella echinulata]|nr:hypothetical protein BJ944DRAFT_241069 [Cunninghamella echinulata]